MKSCLTKQPRSSISKLKLTPQFINVLKLAIVGFPLILLLVLTQSAQLLFAQGAVNGKISGTITDASSGEALPGANILIEGTSLGAASDMEGNYVIAKVPPGSYTLVVTYIGFKAKEFPVRVTP
ncbi:carboxypeptidase-like regulatory domain-containing protein, partial [candidate division KSB1 bacterium]|nr:carboxypeptidase-like regulatory domain-containing protein [candidate division KSB1 bacterium]